LNYVKVELILVKKIKKLINYKFDLLKNVKVFLVFYILLLKSINSSTSIQKTFYYKAQKESKYKVKKILKQQD